jgi:signal transduction histidine kinase
MKTYFAPPERASERDLDIEIGLASRSPVMSGLLQSVGGLLAILNEHRQIIALNDEFLRTLGIDDPKEALGLRPGEVLCCIHSGEEPAGCGTTKFCSTCGAAVAIVSSLGDQVPIERLCALDVRRDGRLVNIALLVRAQPIAVDGKRLLLLLVHDVTVEQRRAALERTFFHDINNLLSVLLQSCELLAEEHPNELTELVADTSRRLQGEVAVQRYLSSTETGHYRAAWRTCGSNKIAAQIQRFLSRHPAACGKQIEYSAATQDVILTTDTSALFRVLSNMVLNALEATKDGGVVRMWVEPHERQVAFCVWNQAAIPYDVQQRLFQRNFSTKAEAGRGIGTFSMKLLGEEVLGGQVGFTSSEAEGTVFRFTHPIGEPSPSTYPEGR